MDTVTAGGVPWCRGGCNYPTRKLSEYDVAHNDFVRDCTEIVPSIPAFLALTSTCLINSECNLPHRYL